MPFVVTATTPRGLTNTATVSAQSGTADLDDSSTLTTGVTGTRAEQDRDDGTGAGKGSR